MDFGGLREGGIAGDRSKRNANGGLELKLRGFGGALSTNATEAVLVGPAKKDHSHLGSAKETGNYVIKVKGIVCVPGFIDRCLDAEKRLHIAQGANF